MGPLEVLFVTVVLVFVFIALVRGYPKELGISTIVFAALFVITEFGIIYLPKALDTFAQALNLSSYDQSTQKQLTTFILSMFLILVVFAAYAGSTLAFPGEAKKGGAGIIINLLVGLLNGYLVAGTLWWLQDINDYPVAETDILTLPLTSWAETFANYLPPYIVPSIFWAVMVVVMLILRIRR